MAEQVFPQSGDFDDAANFAQLIGQANLLDFVETGMSFTLNAGTPDLDITAGKAFVQSASGTGGQSGKSLTRLGFVVEKDAETGIALTDTTTNYVYLNPRLNTNDAAIYEVNTSDTPPNADSIKIGEVDTDADTVTELNREPSVTFDTVQVDGATTMDSALSLNANLNLSGNIDLEGAGADTTLTLDDTFDLIVEDDAGTDIWTFLESGGAQLNSGDLIDGSSNVIFDQSNNWVPDSIIEQSSLDAQTVKGNDIDSNGDGKVDSADSADSATNSSQLGGVAASEYNTFNVTTVSDTISGNTSKTVSTGVSVSNVISVFVRPDDAGLEIGINSAGDVTYDANTNNSGNLDVDFFDPSSDGTHSFTIVVLHN